MNGYVAGGYIACLGTLSTYAISLVHRDRSLRRRLGAARSRDQAAAAEQAGLQRAALDEVTPAPEERG